MSDVCLLQRQVMISLEHLFTTNQAPDDEEQKILKHLVVEYDDKLATITSKISNLEAQLQILNGEKTAILEAVAPFKRALSPFRQLPEDIVREIFVACLPTGRNPNMSNTEAPVLLTQISSATRRISLATPALWAAIHIPIVYFPECMDYAKSIMAARAKGVEEWLLRRSGNLPLHISVNHPRNYFSDSYLGQETIDIVISCCSRWRQLSFSRVPKILSCISSMTGDDVPALQSLSVDPAYSEREDIQYLKSTSILMAPNLRRLSLSGIVPRSTVYVNWSNLTHIGFPLYLSAPGFIDHLAMTLRQTTCLTSCNLSIPGGHAPLHPIDEISLPFLKVLIVSDYTDTDTEVGLPASIRAPALEAIQYNAYGDGAAIPLNLIALLKQAPNLQELWMGNFADPLIFAECLRHCPSITRLRFVGFNYHEDEQDFIKNNAVIEAFVLDDNTRCLCPQLEYFHCDNYLNLSISTLRKFITGRNGPNKHLSRWNSVVIKVRYHPADEQACHIDELTAENAVGDMKLLLLFEKWTCSRISLDQGEIKSVETPQDVWWQGRSKLMLGI